MLYLHLLPLEFLADRLDKQDGRPCQEMIQNVTRTFPWSTFTASMPRLELAAQEHSVYSIQYIDQNDLIIIPFMIDMNCLLPLTLRLLPITGLYSSTTE